MKGSLFVVSAPAGCGKDTILNEMFKRTDTAGSESRCDESGDTAS